MPLNCTKAETEWRCSNCWETFPAGSDANWVPFLGDNDEAISQIKAIVNTTPCSAWCNRCVVTRGIAGQ